ncbi:MAG: uroporphyrinogen decarboxylase family protein [Planctomycetota bacterium]|jgi:hypothetical protein
MKADEYDRLIDDPTAFLYEVWLPRVSSDVAATGDPASYRGTLALVKGAMAMMQYFAAFGPQCERLRAESGTASAIAGILKAPFDILADKLRGYIGLMMDMFTQPEKVLAACEALMPHLCHVALTTADPDRLAPVGYYMHRGCTPFVTPEQFDSHYWPTIRPIIEELWGTGHQTLFYAEGDWDRHLEAFATLPERSIVYHVDRGDVFEAHAKLGAKFCLGGGIPNSILSFGTPDQVRARVREVIDGVARDGGYVLDASAIMQDDTKPENLKALTDFAREYGVYSGATGSGPARPPAEARADGDAAACGSSRTKPGVCIPWDAIRSGLGDVPGDEDLARRIWEEVDSLGVTFIWQCLLSF